MDSSSNSVAGDSLSESDEFVSKAAIPAMAKRIPAGANDTEVSDVSQLLFLVDSHSADPYTTIRAFDINGNSVHDYSVTIPEASLPVYGMGFTVIGVNLYMVGGICRGESSYDYESDEDCVLPTGEIPNMNTRTYILNLHRIQEALEFGKDLFPMMERGPRMKHKKTLPIVYAVNQTLYVLSRWVHSEEHSSFIDFESLGLGAGGSSSALPNPSLRYYFTNPGYYGSVPPSFRVGSHALVDDKSIVISFEDNRIVGMYVFGFESSEWTFVDTNAGSSCIIGQPIMVSSGLPPSGLAHIIGQPIKVSSGFYYALSPSGSALLVLDTIPSTSSKEVKIREASLHVCSLTSHYIATMGDAIFIFRTGCPSETDIGPVYLTIDKYVVSGNTITPQGGTITYLYTESTWTSYPLASLFLNPVSLGT